MARPLPVRAGQQKAVGLTEEPRPLILGYPSRSTFHNWCKKAREHADFTLDADALTRISAVLGIHQALGILFPQERLGVDWLRSPHNSVVFGGHPPLDLITCGSQDGLLTVRRFLDGARGGLETISTSEDGSCRVPTCMRAKAMTHPKNLEDIRTSGGAGVLYDSLRVRAGINVVAHRPRNIVDILQTDHFEITVLATSQSTSGSCLDDDVYVHRYRRDSADKGVAVYSQWDSDFD